MTVPHAAILHGTAWGFRRQAGTSLVPADHAAEIIGVIAGGRCAVIPYLDGEAVMLQGF